MEQMIYTAEKAAVVAFDMKETAATGFTVVGQFFRNGAEKDENGKLLKIKRDDASVATPNIRIWCNIQLGKDKEHLYCMELPKMNAAGFDKVVDPESAENGILIVKTGAKVSCAGGIVKFTM